MPSDQVLQQSSLFNNSASYTYSVQTSSINPVNASTLDTVADLGTLTITSSTVQATNIQIISHMNYTMRFYLAPFGYSVYENGLGNLTVNIPCAVSGIQINYSLIEYGQSTAPTWISLDTENSLLTVDTTNTQSGNYAFYVNAEVDGHTYKQMYSLSVMQCSSANCEE